MHFSHSFIMPSHQQPSCLPLFGWLSGLSECRSKPRPYLTDATCDVFVCVSESTFPPEFWHRFSGLQKNALLVVWWGRCLVLSSHRGFSWNLNKMPLNLHDYSLRSTQMFRSHSLQSAVVNWHFHCKPSRMLEWSCFVMYVSFVYASIDFPQIHAGAFDGVLYIVYDGHVFVRKLKVVYCQVTPHVCCAKKNRSACCICVEKNTKA